MLLPGARYEGVMEAFGGKGWYCTEPAQISTVDDSVHGLGANSSIAIGLDGLPIISYADATSGALRVLKCGSRSCQ